MRCQRKSSFVRIAAHRKRQQHRSRRSASTPVQGIGMPQGTVPYQNGAAVAVKKKNKMLPLIIIGSVVGGIIILVVIICIVAALRSDDFSIDTVKDGTLMDFDEGATIGEAFDDAFHDGSWYYDEDNDTDEKYVVFDGYFYSEDDDEIEVRIGFRHDPDVHDSNEFEVFAVELEDDYGDEADVSDDMEGFSITFSMVIHLNGIGTDCT